MNRIVTLVLGLVILVSFQNCGKSSFASAKEGSEGRTDCRDTTSCIARELALGLFDVKKIESLTYTRLGQFMVARPEHRYGVRITLDHVRGEIYTCPLIQFNAQTSNLIKTTPAYRCGPTFGKAAYNELLMLLGNAKLVTLNHPPMMIDGGVARLELNSKEGGSTFVFEASDERRDGDQVIRDSGALEEKLREYTNLDRQAWD